MIHAGEAGCLIIRPRVCAAPTTLPDAIPVGVGAGVSDQYALITKEQYRECVDPTRDPELLLRATGRLPARIRLAKEPLGLFYIVGPLL